MARRRDGRGWQLKTSLSVPDPHYCSLHHSHRTYRPVGTPVQIRSFSPNFKVFYAIELEKRDTKVCAHGGILPYRRTSDNTLGGQIPVRTNLGDFGSTPRSSSDKNGGSDRAHLDPVRTKITGLSRLRDLLGHKTGTKLGVNAFRTKSCADLHLKEHENDSRNEIFAWWPSKFPFLEAYGIIG
ncbi:hypothetical protein B0H12DRAFT_1076103 [Mycena haematopus]|nr:hypothetical protein B0H12DRAFT_1076103 [Mycena haematopus]